MINSSAQLGPGLKRLAGSAVSRGIAAISLCAALGAGCSDDCFGQETLDSEERTANVHFKETVNTGVLFLNGKFIASPMVVEAKYNAVIVNGLPFVADSEIDAAGPGIWGDDGSDYGESDYVERETRNRTPGELSDGDARGGNRRNGGQRFINEEDDRRGRAVNQLTNRPRVPTSVRSARRLTGWLNDGLVVIAFDRQPVRMVNTASEELELFDALLADKPTKQQQTAFMALAGMHTDSTVWGKWLTDFTADSTARAYMQSRIDTIRNQELLAQQQISAVARLNAFAYPLTLVGMLLGVIAFGHMLKWTSSVTQNMNSQSAGSSPESARFVVISLGLMLGMSVLDLAWTVLAGQAGVMKEVNPVAAQFIHSPSQLALFKVFATIVGFTILYAWRQRQQIQQATWWMCLVSVLLTFRWVVFDSMLN